MQLNDLKSKQKRTVNQRVGRGGKRGTTSGRGTKGQKSRAGHRMRPELRDMIKKLPKLRGRGMNSNKSIQAKPLVVSLKALEVAFADGGVINPKTLRAKGLVATERGRMPVIKILGGSLLAKKFIVSECEVSTGAKAAIEKAGGSVTASS